MTNAQTVLECNVTFVTSEPAFTVGANRVLYTPLNGGKTGTLAAQIPPYAAEPQVYVREILAVLQLSGRNRHIEAFDDTAPTPTDTVIRTNNGSSGSVSMGAFTVISGPPFTRQQLADAETALATVDAASADDKKRLRNALRGYRNVQTERNPVPRFKMAWTGIEALLRTGEKKTVPIKRFFVNRYSALPATQVGNKIQAVYKIRNLVDHEDKNTHPDLGTALPWAHRAFAEALAEKLGFDIGHELTFT
ncbi:MAG: hypothetical protein ACXWCW_22135 [Burkholderiales bacterium]